MFEPLEALMGHISGYFSHLTASQIMMNLMGASAVAITAVEGWAISRLPDRKPYDWRAFWTTVRINMWRFLVEAIPMGAVLGVAIPFGAWMYEHRFFTVPMDYWWSWVAMFFTTEFFYYWLHRAGHRIRWYWASHQVHHTGNQYNLAAAFRQSITGKISGGFVFFAPQCFFGFSPETVAISYMANLIYQFWIHTDLIGKIPLMEGIFNTPSAHRVHHAANVEYLDCNYGGTLLIFDRLFGTYVAEKDNVPIRYGLVKEVTTYSAIWICLFEWAALFRDAGKALLHGHPIDALGYMFGPPGWAPNGEGLTTDALRHQMQAVTGAPAGVPPPELLDRMAHADEVSGSPAPAR
jgi:sterol desaturase/sphingolipid hydroxylase (fatty acid hydroxylase superfamily)